ncbi:MAG: hypothetical protein ABGY11_07250 [Candidatus Thioglobus sp.]
MPDKVTITPATGKIVFQANVNGTLTEVGSIDAESGNSADQIVINKAKLTNGEISGGSF